MDMARRDVEIAEGYVRASLGSFPALNDASGAKERQPHLVVASHMHNPLT